MPELPEVESTKNVLLKIIKNTKICKVEIFNNKLRWEIKYSIKKSLTKVVLKAPYRLGKYILIPTNTNKTILIHLGMSGSLKIQKEKLVLLKHDHVKFTLLSEKKETIYLIYNDPRRFGFIDVTCSDEIKLHFLLRKIGIDPFNKEFNHLYLIDKFKNKNVTIKSALMNQKVIAGIGNIYANEILFLAKVHPLKKVKLIDFQTMKRLVYYIKYVLKEAIKNGGTSLKDYKSPDGKLGYFKQKLFVYDRLGLNCLICGSQIKMLIINKRSSFICEKCQGE